MRVLNRYIAKAIIITSVIVILAVAGLSFIISLLGELQDIGTGDYGFSQAVMHVLLKLPHDLYQFLPMLLLLGGVIGLGILSAHHELMVMRASGLSIQKIMGAVLMAALVLVLIGTLLGEGIAPQGIYLADKQKQSAENKGQAIATKSGVWLHEGNNFLHIERVMGRRHLEGVKRFEFDGQHHLLAAYYVKSIDFYRGQWHLQDWMKTSFLHDRTESQHFAASTWDLALNPNLLTVGMVEPEELSLPNLAKYSEHLVENRLQANRFQFEFWRRVFQPLTTLVMILLAVPFVFSSPRSVTMGWRILLGILLGFAFYILNAFLGQFSVVFQISPLIAALFPTILFAIGGYILLWKLKH